MQKILLLTLFLFVASFIKAAELPRLNLEIGKKYTIETIYHEDTSKTNPRREYDKKIFEFTPTGFDKNKGIYDVKVVISYFMHVVQEIGQTEVVINLIQKRSKYFMYKYGDMPKPGVWTEKEVYETGYPSTFSRPVVFMNKNQVPVTFKMTNEGLITSFDFSAFYNYKTSADREPNILGEWDQKEMEVEIRGMFFNADEFRAPRSGTFKLRSGYTIINENETSAEIKVDAAGKTGSMEQFKRKVLIDKSTGLILEDKLSYLWTAGGPRNITRYQKWIQIFSEKFEAYQKTADSKYEKTDIINPNTAVRVTVQDSTEYSKFIYLTYYDQVTGSFQLYQLEKGRKGVFNFQMHMDQPMPVYLLNNPENHANVKAELIFLSPGDNLEVEIRKYSDPNGIIFNGIGAAENRLKRSTLDRNSQFFLSNSRTILNPDSAYQILNQLRSEISPELYLEIGNMLLYSKYLRNSFLEDSISNLKIPICNTLAVRNFEYFIFLNRYIDSSAENIRLSSSNYKPSAGRYERDYSFAQVLFPEPILTEYLAYTIEEALRYWKWENARLLYERHILNSPESPRTLKTKQIYQQRVRFAPGSIFPIEKTVDINGEVFNFHKEKNKLVIITTNQLFTKTDLVKETELWRHSKRDYVSLRDNIIQVRLVIGRPDQLSELKAVLGLNYNERIIFINFWDSVLRNIPSVLLLSGKTMVLGRDGLILYDREVDSLLL